VPAASSACTCNPREAAGRRQFPEFREAVPVAPVPGWSSRASPRGHLRIRREANSEWK
jgi:hypothetical protein